MNSARCLSFAVRRCRPQRASCQRILALGAIALAVLSAEPVWAQRVVLLYGGVAKVTLGKGMEIVHWPKDNTYTVDFTGDIYGRSVHINRERPSRPEKVFSLAMVKTFHRGIVNYYHDNKKRFNFRDVRIRRSGRAITMRYQSSYLEDGKRRVSKTISKVLLPQRGGLIQADHSPDKFWMWKGNESRAMQQVVDSLRL